MHQTHSYRTLVLLLGALLGSCGVLVDPESLVIKCQTQPGVRSVDPCGQAAMHCVSGVCRPCAPGAVEICGDGKDNDCDGKIDEAPECPQSRSCGKAACVGGLVCNTQSGECVIPADGGLHNGKADSGLLQTGTPDGGLQTGAPDATPGGCSSDTECGAGFCLKPGELDLQVTLVGSRCTTACCVDSDCGAGALCVTGTSGARVCVPTDRSTGQPKKAGASCAHAAECASGICSRNMCRARCTSDNACGNDSCVLSGALAGSSQYFICGGGAGRGSGGDLCTPFDPTACKSGWCLSTSTCAKPCATNADCGGASVCALAAVPTLVPDATPLRAGICQSDATSADKLCCTSAQCGSGQVCRPKSSADAVSMVCQAP